MTDTIRACPLCRWCAWESPLPEQNPTFWFECRHELPTGAIMNWPGSDVPDKWCRLFELDLEFGGSPQERDVSERETVKCLEMDLPIIADLGDGWFLAAHPNGVCIANENFISTLWAPDDLDGINRIPGDVQRKAIDEFEAFAWTLIKAEFYPE